MSAKETENVETLESGDVFFFYRPRVEEDEPGGRKDVQRLYMVLKPDDRDRYRLTIIGAKRLPRTEASGRDRIWGFVDLVRNQPGPIRQSLSEETYETKTRGERRVPPARPAGEGRYRVVRHDDHTHLVYALELPRRPGKVQDALEIEPQASYIISVKNPQKGSPQAAGLRDDRQVEFPRKLMDRFEDRRFADLDPPEFLDHEGAEFLLVAASDDLEKELGIRLDTQREDERSADIFRQLKLDREEHPARPFLEGEWE